MSDATKPNRIQVIKPKQANKPTGRILGKIDNWQMSHPRVSFTYAILKKYGDDNGGNQAALVTYYGFLSLFPLLVAALSLTELSIFHNAHLKGKILNAMNSYFPLIGKQLSDTVHAQTRAGIALGISLLITIYGARGVATALRQAMDHIWLVPQAERSTGVKGKLRSLAVIFLAGIGFLITGILSSFGAGKAGNIGLNILAMVVSLALTYILLLSVYKLSISPKFSFRDLSLGAAVAAVGLQIVQAAGGFLITHELRHFSSLYGSLAIVFVVLFWIYLQVRILLYATEIDVIRKFRLWPRSIAGFKLTPGDRKALRMYAQREAYIEKPSEKVEVEFSGEPVPEK